MVIHNFRTFALFIQLFLGGVCNPDDNVGGVCNPECKYLFQPHITCPFVGPHIFIR